MATRASYAVRHLLARLEAIDVLLDAAAAKRGKLAETFLAAGAKPDVITRGHVNAVLGYVSQLDRHLGMSGGASPPVVDEESLRASAAKEGVGLPLDELAAALELTEFEQEAIVLCAAPSVDSAYGLAIAYVHDDATARAPSIELVASLSATDLDAMIERRAQLGPLGRLRRLGLLSLRPRGHSHLQHELVLTDAAIHYVFGGAGDPHLLFRDPADVYVDPDTPAPLGVDFERCMKLATAFAQREIDMMGIFGGREATRREVAHYIAARTGHTLRRLQPGANPQEAVEAAAALNAILWVDLECLEDSMLAACGPLTTALASGSVNTLLTGANAWRPPRVLESRAYAEIHVASVPVFLRRQLWLQELPELTETKADELARRFRFVGPEIRAAANVARATARALRNGQPVTPDQTVDDACAAIARPSSTRFGRLIEPRKEAPRLVLPKQELQQVGDVVRLYRLGPKVLDDWRFSTRMTSSGGVKALFAGEPGTGKTLAAEVIAGQLGLPLFKIDLARVVSKWVGETEKNLDDAFREAEDSHAVLFFDEAEALFGARADVRTGADRYANLEVSFLLQRLDAFAGVAILATNLRDKIDAAFTRRFDVLIAFPRPTFEDRLALWEEAIPQQENQRGLLDPEVDLDSLARIELTGAGIFATAQAAAFLAAEQGAETIQREHLLRALERQFQREARVFTSDDFPLTPHSWESS